MGAQRKHAAGALDEYAGKRDFSVTSEPSSQAPARRTRAAGGAGAKAAKTRQPAAAPDTGRFVVQEHHARSLHYDFRLELDGTLKSWAVPKGPSLDPGVRRLAVHVEDHPLAYAGFEGHIPAGQYGAGEVIVWDRGRWASLDPDPSAAYRAGKLKFRLAGEKLSGAWTLVRTRLPGSGGKEQWLLIKDRDDAARPDGGDIAARGPDRAPAANGRPPAARGHAGEAADRPSPLPSGGALDGAQRAALPARLEPQLATLVRQAPAGDWRYEVKFDGYRLLARLDAGRARLYTRNGLDWTGRLPAFAAGLAALPLGPAWLDGEIVVLDTQGRPDFQALQNAFETGEGGGIVYFVFDIPYHDGFDLRGCALESRRALLRELLAQEGEAGGDGTIHYSRDLAVEGGDALRSACQLGLEGVIGKRAGSRYRAGRGADWIKLKCGRRQEFVIGGYTPPQGRRSGFGALLLGVHDAGGALRYAGRVGTGFGEASLTSLLAAMRPLLRPRPPFADPPRGRQALGVTWVEPRLVCEVDFAGWTRDGQVRQAAFRGLRADKPAPEVERETPAPPPGPNGKDAANGPPAAAKTKAGRKDAGAVVAGVRISHPARVIDPQSGVTKLALAEFYRDVADRLLPHLRGRPAAIVRAPDGVGGEQFFQRHPGAAPIPGIRAIFPDGASGEGKGDPGDDALMQLDTLAAVIGAVQMGGIEFHVGNADGAHLERPDKLVFDLDPDPRLPWARVVEATRLLLTLLDELALRAFLKTSGGKGMHVVVPLQRRHGWAQVKEFSQAVAVHLAGHLPQRFTARMGPRNRVGKVFVDYLRNQPGGTTVAAYSARARPGMGVSVPIARDELDAVAGAAAWTVTDLRQRLASLKTDPWAGYANDQRITADMRRRLGLKD